MGMAVSARSAKSVLKPRLPAAALSRRLATSIRQAVARGEGLKPQGVDGSLWRSRAHPSLCAATPLREKGIHAEPLRRRGDVRTHCILPASALSESSVVKKGNGSTTDGTDTGC